MTIYPIYNSKEIQEFIKENSTDIFHPEMKCVALDVYYGIYLLEELVALGFIRGWTDYWEDKVLGICVKEDCRGQGWGSLMMNILHQSAKYNGVPRLRLHVHPDNTHAINLYTKYGYEHRDTRANGELIMYREIE